MNPCLIFESAVSKEKKKSNSLVLPPFFCIPFYFKFWGERDLLFFFSKTEIHKKQNCFQIIANYLSISHTYLVIFMKNKNIVIGTDFPIFQLEI
jgi:hypothetical protein